MGFEKCRGRSDGDAEARRPPRTVPVRAAIARELRGGVRPARDMKYCTVRLSLRAMKTKKARHGNRTNEFLQVSFGLIPIVREFLTFWNCEIF